MSLNADVHLVAGLIALVLGVGALLRGPRLPQNWLFAGLCASLAAWTLGVATPLLLGRRQRDFELVYLLGGALAPAFALHFAARGGLSATPWRRLLIVSGYLAGLGVWLAAVFGARDHGPGWPATALSLLGLVLFVTMGIFLRQLVRWPPGPTRTAHAWLLATALLAGLAGLSDLLPRESFPRVGPIALLPFLFVLCAVVLRHRFLDLDDFLARAVAVALGAAAASLCVVAAIRLAGGPRLLPIFAACLIVMSAAAPLGALVLRKTRRLFGARSPEARAIEEAARAVAAAESAGAAWVPVESAREELGADVRLLLQLRDAVGDWEVTAALGPGSPPAPLEDGSALAGLLREGRAGVTRRHLEDEARARVGARSRRALKAQANFDDWDVDLVVPVFRANELVGAVALGGLPERAWTAELARSLEGLGAQVLAALERAEAAEAARRAESLAAVGELAAGLAHEVRNPLGAIRGAAQVLAEASSPAQEKEMLEVVEEETARLGRVVGEFLAYARPESSRREAVEVCQLLESVARELRVGLGANVELACEGGVVLGDPDQLHRACANLLRNGHEAAGPDGRLRVDARPDDEGMIALRFEDDGPGIAPEEVDRVFQPFHTTRPSGTGLGLALVQRIVDAHGGRIELDPRPGVGAVFTLRLPAAEAVS